MKWSLMILWKFPASKPLHLLPMAILGVFAQIAGSACGRGLAPVHGLYLSEYFESAQGGWEMVLLMVGFLFLHHPNASEFFS